MTDKVFRLDRIGQFLFRRGEIVVKNLICILLVFVTCLVAVAQEPFVGVKIPVTHVKVSPTRIQGYSWRIEVTGIAPSAGWTDVWLLPMPNKTGTIAFMLVGKPPKGAALVETPVAASKFIKSEPEVSHVRVYGQPKGPQDSKPWIEVKLAADQEASR